MKKNRQCKICQCTIHNDVDHCRSRDRKLGWDAESFIMSKVTAGQEIKKRRWDVGKNVDFHHVFASQYCVPICANCRY